jgi:hypothetical protein
MPKALRIISEADVDRIFDAKCIKALAKTSKLSNKADIRKFGEEIRGNARIYLKTAAEPTNNELHDEIKALHDASDKQNFEQTRHLVENLSSRARSALIGRWEQSNPGIEFPKPTDLDDVEYREVVSAKIASLCRLGGKIVETRMRKSGRKSKTWQVLYYAPPKTRHFSKTAAAKQLVMHLAIMWCDITGKMPPIVSHPEAPGPFPRLVMDCFTLLGSRASAVKIINRYGKQRVSIKF